VIDVGFSENLEEKHPNVLVDDHFPAFAALDVVFPIVSWP